MDVQRIVGLIALAWLIGGVALAGALIRRGRRLTGELETKHPAAYEELGRPRPGFLHSSRRRRFAQFLGRREYLKLDDSELTVQFEDYRRREVRLLLILLFSLIAVGALVLYAR